MRRIRLLLSALCFIMTVLGCESDVAGPLVQDVRAVRESNRLATIDIAHVIQKHIPIGMSRDDVHRVLSNEGFKLYPQPQKADEPEELMATRHAGTPQWIGYDEIRVVIKFREDVAVTVSGWLYYNAI